MPDDTTPGSSANESGSDPLIDSGRLHDLGWNDPPSLPTAPGELLEWRSLEEDAAEVVVASDPDVSGAWISIERDDLADVLDYEG